MEKRRFRPFLFAVAGITSIALCGLSSAAVSLQLKLPKGKTYYQRNLADQHITQTVMNNQQTVEVSVGMGQKLDVLDVDSAGNMQIRYTFIWVMNKQTTPMGSVSYDSAQQQTTPPPGTEPLAALLNQSYTVKLSPQGRVLDIQGVEQMKAAVQKKLPPGAEAGPMANVVNPFTDKQGLKEITESMMAIYPDKPVDMGQSWTDKRVLTAGFGRIEEAKWTLLKEEAGVAVLGVTGKIQSNPNAAPMENQGMKMRFDIGGTMEGAVRIVEETGLIQSDQAHQQLKGEIRLEGGGQGQPAMAIPMVIDSNSKVEMSEKMWQTAPAAPPATK